MNDFPDRWKYKFKAGDFVVARKTHRFSDSVSIIEGQTYRVMKVKEQGYDGVVLEELPRNPPMLASRFVPAPTQKLLMPDNRNYYNLITMGDDDERQTQVAERHQAGPD